MSEAVKHAEWLIQQHREAAPFRSFVREGGLSLAYDVQDRYVELMLAEHDGAVAGYKIGLTTPRMQAMCGIDHPIAGVVPGARVHRSPARVRLSGFAHLGVESELAVRIARPLRAGAHATLAPADVLAHVDVVAAAFELVDDRGADYRTLDVQSLVADNSWNAGIVLGEPRVLTDLRGLAGALEVDGTVVDRGDSSAVLGDPAAAVAWLATHLAARGRALEPGQWVMTGSIVPTRFAESGQHYRFALGPLPPVELSII